MPLRTPIPAALAGDRFNFGAGQSLDYNGMVAHIEQLMAQGDVTTAIGRSFDLVNALQVAVDNGAIAEGDAFWNEVQAFYAGVQAWARGRTQAGPGGQGVIVTAPQPGALTVEQALAAGAAQISSGEVARVSEIFANVRASDLRPGETVEDAVARLHREQYGSDAPAHALAALPASARVPVGQFVRPGETMPAEA
ncbi:MAG: hypothetical protein AB1762_20645, partial [Gemmatimonadota bacterium]